MTDTAEHFGPKLAVQKANRRRFAVIVSIVLLLLAGAASIFLMRSVEGQLQDVIRTYEVRTQARQLINSLLDAESGQRGYLLTQNPDYLQPYNAAVDDIDANINQLLDLTQDNTAQRARVLGVIADIDKKRVEMASTVKFASEGRMPEAIALLNTDAGVTLMDNIRAAINGFIGEEDRMLSERNNVIERYRAMLVGAILVALACAAVLAYAIFTRTQRQFGAFWSEQNWLVSHNEELEASVRERAAALEEAKAHAERERARVETLLQDTNHRIGNSLATVSSLLGLQVNRTHSPEVKVALEAAQSRVQTIASGHRRLRLGDDLETTRADEFLSAVMEDLQTTQVHKDNLTFETDFDPIVINARDATTLGIILGELVTNALKHAFVNGRAGHLSARLKRLDDGRASLCVEDNGVGLPIADGRGDGGLGSMIIRQLANQFGGEPRYEARADGGTSVTIILSRIEHK